MEEEKRLLASSSSESSSSRLIFFLFHLFFFFFLSKLCARLSPLSLSFVLFYSLLSSDAIEKKKKKTKKKKKKKASLSLFSSFECLLWLKEYHTRRENKIRHVIKKREKVPLLTKKVCTLWRTCGSKKRKIFNWQLWHFSFFKPPQTY